MSGVSAKESAFEALIASLGEANAVLPGVAMAAFRKDGKYLVILSISPVAHTIKSRFLS